VRSCAARHQLTTIPCIAGHKNMLQGHSQTPAGLERPTAVIYLRDVLVPQAVVGERGAGEGISADGNACMNA